MVEEVFQEWNNAKYPSTFYSTASTKAELAALIRKKRNAWAIGADLPPHSAFSFFQYADAVAFLGVWLDADGKEISVREAYPTAEDGIEAFKFNGKPLFDVLKGARFAPFDMPLFI